MSHGTRPHGARVLQSLRERRGSDDQRRYRPDPGDGRGCRRADRRERHRTWNPTRSSRPPVPAVRNVRQEKWSGPRPGAFEADAARPRRGYVGERQRARRRVSYAPAARESREGTPHGNPQRCIVGANRGRLRNSSLYNEETMRSLVVFCAGTMWLHAQSAELTPETLLLAKIRQHMSESLQRQPNYTCVETVERSNRTGAARKFQLGDTLRLEVALVDG